MQSGLLILKYPVSHILHRRYFFSIEDDIFEKKYRQRHCQYLFDKKSDIFCQYFFSIILALTVWRHPQQLNVSYPPRRKISKILLMLVKALAILSKNSICGRIGYTFLMKYHWYWQCFLKVLLTTLNAILLNVYLPVLSNSINFI